MSSFWLVDLPAHMGQNLVPEEQACMEATRAFYQTVTCDLFFCGSGKPLDQPDARAEGGRSDASRPAHLLSIMGHEQKGLVTCMLVP